MVRALSSTGLRLVVANWMDAMSSSHLESVGVFSLTNGRTFRCKVDVGSILHSPRAAGFRFASSVRTRDTSSRGRRPRLPAVVSRQASERGTAAWDEAARLYFSGEGDPVRTSSEDSPPKKALSPSWKQTLSKIKAGQNLDDSKDAGYGARKSTSDWGSRNSSDLEKGRKEKSGESRGQKSGTGAETFSNEAFAAREWAGVGSPRRRVDQEISDFTTGDKRSVGKSRSSGKDYSQQNTSATWSRRDEVSRTGSRRASGPDRWETFDEDEEEEMEEEEMEEDEERRPPRRRGGVRDYSEQSTSRATKVVGEVVYGVSPIKAALQASRRKFHALYVQVGLEEKLASGKKKDKAAVALVLGTAKSLGLPMVVTSKHNLNLLAENRPHQGLILDASPLELVLTEELEYPEPQKGVRPPVWVALDEIMDPQNFGAILRSAFYLGAQGVVVCAKNSAPLSGVVSKASSGALEAMEVQYCKNMVKFIDRCVQNGWQAVGASTEPRAVSVWDLAPARPTLLVLGNEGKGLRTNVRRACTETVCISGAFGVSPTYTTEGSHASSGSGDESVTMQKPEVEALLRPAAVDSLNVSVAAGILLHHLLTRPIDEPPEVISSRDLAGAS